jgi:hypothetical protein
LPDLCCLLYDGGPTLYLYGNGALIAVPRRAAVTPHLHASCVARNEW